MRKFYLSTDQADGEVYYICLTEDIKGCVGPCLFSGYVPDGMNFLDFALLVLYVEAAVPVNSRLERLADTCCGLVQKWRVRTPGTPKTVAHIIRDER